MFGDLDGYMYMCARTRAPTRQREQLVKSACGVTFGWYGS